MSAEHLSLQIQILFDFQLISLADTDFRLKTNTFFKNSGYNGVSKNDLTRCCQKAPHGRAENVLFQMNCRPKGLFCPLLPWSLWPLCRNLWPILWIGPPVDFFLFSRFSVLFSKEIAPKCGENCPISSMKFSSFAVEMFHEMVWLALCQSLCHDSIQNFSQVYD